MTEPAITNTSNIMGKIIDKSLPQIRQACVGESSNIQLIKELQLFRKEVRLLRDEMRDISIALRNKR